MIYFIQDQGTRLVKIGFSEKPWGRLAKMRVDCPSELHLRSIIEGGKVEERALHRRFAAYHARGEWFKCEGAFAVFIAALPLAEMPGRKRKARIALMDALAEATGVAQQVARAWLDRDSIPGHHWLAISEAGVMTLQELAIRHASPDKRLDAA